jgi:hypothetical protein
MDQNNLQFNMTIKTTITREGAKNVNVKKAKTTAGGVTACLTVAVILWGTTAR